MNKTDEKKVIQIIMFAVSMLILGKGISSIGEISFILTVIMIVAGLLGTIFAFYNYKKSK